MHFSLIHFVQIQLVVHLVFLPMNQIKGIESL